MHDIRKHSHLNWPAPRGSERRSLFPVRFPESAPLPCHGSAGPAAGEALLLLDPQGRVTGCSDAAVRLLGFSAAELSGRPYDSLHTAHQARLGAPDRALLIARREGVHRGDQWRQRRDGTLLKVDGFLSVLGDARGLLGGYCERLRAVSGRATDSGDGAGASGPDDGDGPESALFTIQVQDRAQDRAQSGWAQPRIAHVSRGLERLTGYGAVEAQGQPWHFLFGDGPGAAAAIGEAIRLGRSCSAEVPVRRRDGTVFPGRQHVSPIRDLSGRIDQFVVTIHPIAPGGGGDPAFEQKRQAQKLETIGQMAGGIAHDFNNILTAILGQCSLVEMEFGDDHPVREHIAQIDLAAQRAAGLTRQLLSFSRRQPVEKTVFSLNGAARNLEKMLQRLMNPGIRLAQELRAGSDRIHADVGQIEQVLVNLAVNARDAMPRGGDLTVRTEDAVVEGRPHVRLSVRDTGTGIPAAIRDRLFEPYFTTKGPGKGTGLGLSTVHGIVNEFGGTISVESEVGRGTVFSILLPLAAGPAASAAAAVQPSGWPRGSERILLVDDDRTVRNLLAATLRFLGYEVIEAEDGEQAFLPMAGELGRPIDLLIADLMMPRLGGAKLGVLFRRLHPKAEVLYISGHIDDAVLDGAEADESRFLTKPFSPLILARKVREILDRGKA